VLGVTQSYISKLESGALTNVQPSNEFRDRVRLWMRDAPGA
jgi:predicted transcriptional regulator